MLDSEVTRKYFSGNRWDFATRRNHRTGEIEYYAAAPCGCTLISDSGRDDWQPRWGQGCLRMAHQP